jgi:hypothetical protein
LQKIRDGYVCALAATLALTFAACGRDGGRSEYVARVNGAVLTQADVAHQRDSVGEAGAASREYINEWVVNELLYQEAERRGLTDDAAFREQLDLTRKRLAVAALLQDQVYSHVDSSAVSNDSIAAVYARNPSAYVLHEDVTLASLVVFRDRESANGFRSAVMRGAEWAATLAAIQAKATAGSPILRSADHQFFTRATLFPDEVWKMARSLSHEDVSFPLQTANGYVVLRTHQNFRQGDVPPLAYASAEVRERLLMGLRRARYEEFVGSMRKRYTVDIRESPSGPDSSAVKE